MNIKDTHLTEFDLLNTLWFLWCNQKMTVEDVKKYIKSLDLELDTITLSGYKFINRDRTVSYSYDR
jgi:hypothetical protein